MDVIRGVFVVLK
jgi:hypothetical protein